MKRTRLWSALTTRADAAVASAAAALASAQHLLAELDASAARLARLSLDYENRLRVSQFEHQTGSQISLTRSYIAHLEALHRALSGNRSVAQRGVENARKTYFEQEAERKRVGKLQELDEAKERREQQKTEMAEMNRAAIARFNRG